MAGMGPLPAANPVRRNARTGPVLLPAAGRPGRAPRWPLDGQSTEERRCWAALWKTPQAVAWEAHGWTRTIARYCRVVVRADQPDAGVGILGEARQLEDRLGLNPLAMARLRWSVGAAERSDAGRLASVSSIRERMLAVEAPATG